jgi:hypothetical protein
MEYSSMCSLLEEKQAPLSICRHLRDDGNTLYLLEFRARSAVNGEAVKCSQNEPSYRGTGSFEDDIVLSVRRPGVWLSATQLYPALPGEGQTHTLSNSVFSFFSKRLIKIVGIEIDDTPVRPPSLQREDVKLMLSIGGPRRVKE